MQIELKRTQDILKYLGEHKPEHQFLCGFSMETEHVLENSRKKLVSKHCDMICANSLRTEGAGFAGDTNVVTVISHRPAKSIDSQAAPAASTDIEITELGKLTKLETAHRILDKALSLVCHS